ncbi:MAG: cysteine dioxygenase family protein [Actinomycetota bacterium]|nr:cysteine dioxygenase family protein [Actinomycetota bacterium]MDQ2958337.1 cysteine dioxygenase family protein [Actinomycetota bacterium]
MPLNPVELVEYTRFAAAEVAAGRYPYIRYDESERWHQRLYRDQRVDVWLISWLPSQGTQLHDHGGSAGAFTVLSGELTEAIYQPGRPEGEALRELSRHPSDSAGFGAHYVHDVRNLSDRPAVSVYAYSRPLTTMTFYDIDGDGSLQKLATLATEDPEPAVDLSSLAEPAA